MRRARDWHSEEFAAAEPFAIDALSIAERSARGPQTSEIVGKCLVLLARLKIAAHHSEAARPLLDRAELSLMNSLGQDRASTREALALRASLT